MATRELEDLRRRQSALRERLQNRRSAPPTVITDSVVTIQDVDTNSPLPLPVAGAAVATPVATTTTAPITVTNLTTAAVTAESSVDGPQQRTILEIPNVCVHPSP